MAPPTGIGPVSDPISPERFRIYLGLILLVNMLTVLPFLSATTLWYCDESHYAVISQEMTLTGDWIVPKIGGEPYGSYPPLMYWLMAVAGSIFGFSEFSIRFPCALAGMALVALVGIIGRRLAGNRAGLASSMVMATLPGFLVQQSTARADVLLALFAALAFDRFLVIAEGDRRARNLIVFYMAIVLGFLTKGPLSVVIPGLGIAAWLAITRRWRVLLDLKPWWGVPAVLALVAPWYIAAYKLAGWGFIKLNLLWENVDAFVNGAEHERPFWYYFAITPTRILPWIILLLLSWPVRKTRGWGTAAAWLAAVFIFLTISSAKRPNYLTFLYAPMALSTGIALVAMWKETPHRIRWGLLFFSVVLALAPGMIPFIPIESHEKWVVTADLVGMAVPYIIIAGGILYLITRARGAVAGMFTLVILLLIGSAFYLGPISGRIDHDGFRMVAFAERVRKQVPHGERIGTAGRIEGPFYFYMRQIMPELNGKPGYYLGTEIQRARLAAGGAKIEVLDALIDRLGRTDLLFRVLPP